jgi:hypothetical protein
MRAAVYARYSSDLQSPASIADQGAGLPRARGVAEIIRLIESLRIDASPFINKGTRELMGAVFCRPEVAIEAGCRELTPDGKSRRPRFIGILEDL